MHIFADISIIFERKGILQISSILQLVLFFQRTLSNAKSIRPDNHNKCGRFFQYDFQNKIRSTNEF